MFQFTFNNYTSLKKWIISCYISYSTNAPGDIAAELVTYSQVMGMWTREDIGLMYGQFHTAKAQIGAKLLNAQRRMAMSIEFITLAPIISTRELMARLHAT